MPPILTSAHGGGVSPNIPTAIVPPGVPPHSRPLSGGASDAYQSGGERVDSVRMMESRGMGTGAWSTGGSGPPENAGYGGGGGRGMDREYVSHHHHQQQQQLTEGPPFSNGGRTGGSGRIIPNSSGRIPSCISS